MTVGILTDPSMVVATGSGGTSETLFTQLNTVASGNAANALESSLASNRGVDSRFILSQRPDALMATGDPFLIFQMRKIIDFLESNRIPGMFVVREYVLAGGLMSYGASIPDLFRRSATYVHKILQGTKPSDLPVEQPTKFDLVLNLRTAKTLGLTFPQTLLATADEIVE
jgi:putative ABC transport system substrate-binding protein